MNFTNLNRVQLEESNYVLKADASSNYWFGISKKKLDAYRSRFGLVFNIILLGSEDSGGDFYCIPFIAIQELLKEDSLYLFDGKRQRWVGDIRNHILKIRNSQNERNVSEFFRGPETDLNSLVLQKDNLIDYAIESTTRELKVRVQQSVFRKRVLENFDYQCCLTGVRENELLVASHIIPWSRQIETRLSPHNGLCLSVLYDRLFDEGYFTFTETNDVLITPRMNSLSIQTQRWLSEILGRRFAEPKKFEISKDALEYHRANIFNRFEFPYSTVG